MLIHKYRSIFVHVPKTAGQSIEQFFLSDAGVEWEDRHLFLMGPNSRPSLGPPRLAHLRASEYAACGHVSQQLMKTYFKFCFVRNPWSRAVSFYTFLGLNNDMSFDAFVMDWLPHKVTIERDWFVMPQSWFVYDENDKLLVDYVGRFEALHQSFSTVCIKLGIANPKLPTRNVSSLGQQSVQFIVKHKLRQLRRGRVASYDSHLQGSGFREYYCDPKSVDVISQLYDADVNNFSYQFE